MNFNEDQLMSAPTEQLTTEEAAEHLGLSAATLAQYRYIGKGPRYVKFRGRYVRYHRADLDAYKALMDAEVAS